jgi:hypothetical protein
MGEVSERNTAIDYINRDIVNIKNELQVLNKLVRDGNGQPSLMQQVASISAELTHFETDVKEALADLKDTVSRYHNEAIEKEAEKESNAWQFKGAIYVALISSITSILVMIFNK